MEVILIDAPQAVQRSLIALGLYVILIVPTDALLDLGISLMGKIPENPPFFSRFTFYDLFCRLTIVLLTALAQSIVFSRMARDIDKPLWRYATDREALVQFFPLWTGINFVVVGLFTLAGMALADSENSAQILYLMALLLAAFSIPIGVTIMFRGKVTLETSQEALAVFSRQFPKMLVVILASFWFVFFSLFLAAQTSEQPFLRPFINIIGIYFDCLLCAATIQICRIDRETPEDTSFDF